MSVATGLQMAAIKRVPDRLFQEAYPWLRKLSGQSSVEFDRAGSAVAVTINDERWFVPDARTAIRLTEIGDNPLRRVYERYQLPGFVEVEADDVVVDIGAFIGEFARHAAADAGRVIAVEPGPETTPVLVRNLAQYPGASSVQRPVWNEESVIDMKLGDDPTENSVFGPDTSSHAETLPMAATTVESLTEKHGIEQIDFLKIEAEGAEPEVLDGLGDCRPNKIAVNCDPERDGESPIETVIKQLQKLGYTVKERDTTVYGRWC